MALKQVNDVQRLFEDHRLSGWMDAEEGAALETCLTSAHHSEFSLRTKKDHGGAMFLLSGF